MRPYRGLSIPKASRIGTTAPIASPRAGHRSRRASSRRSESAGCRRQRLRARSSRRCRPRSSAGSEELASLHAFIGRPADGAGRARARGRGGDRQVDALARGRRARARARGCACSRRGRPRPSAASRTSGWAISSRTSSTTCCRAVRRRGGARSRSRSLREEASDEPVDHRALGVAVRDVLQRARRARPDSDRDRRRPVARRLVGERARVRAAKARRRATCSCCSPGGSSTAASRRRSSRHSTPSASSGCRSDRSASARSTGSCATASAGRSRARRCSASTSGRAEIRSSRWSWPRVLDADVDPLEPLAGSRDARRARPREALRPARDDSRGARARLGARHAVGVAPRAGGRCSRTRSSRRSPRT